MSMIHNIPGVFWKMSTVQSPWKWLGEVAHTGWFVLALFPSMGSPGWKQKNFHLYPLHCPLWGRWIPFGIERMVPHPREVWLLPLPLHKLALLKSSCDPLRAKFPFPNSAMHCLLKTPTSFVFGQTDTPETPFPQVSALSLFPHPSYSRNGQVIAHGLNPAHKCGSFDLYGTFAMLQ